MQSQIVSSPKNVGVATGRTNKGLSTPRHVCNLLQGIAARGKSVLWRATTYVLFDSLIEMMHSYPDKIYGRSGCRFTLVGCFWP